ncbi:MAG: hypothetical protein M1827_002863 [Pycnora praestabilis]|nr:MAG: hypothetical protein M1827_002863 [Pycnora praestabilis]
MAQRRITSSSEGQKEPHSISLKVLRLSRPSLAIQHPLPRAHSSRICTNAALSYPASNSDDQFILSPLLTLPPAFGSAYVGETFSCTLCANNEFPEKNDGRLVNAVRISAEMQTPSQTIPLDLTPAGAEPAESSLSPGQSLQKIVRFDLKEEGSHTLSVVTRYSETLMSTKEGSSTRNEAAGGRVRTFRKLYQFIAQPCLAVRTKLTPLSCNAMSSPSQGSSNMNYALEAQLENVGESVLLLQGVTMNTTTQFKSTSLNWDGPVADKNKYQSPILNPHDVMQVAFLVKMSEVEDGEVVDDNIASDGRLGQVSIEWRSAMGDRGYLTTVNDESGDVRQLREIFGFRSAQTVMDIGMRF